MINCPKTKEEARNIRYGEWSGNPKGHPYNENCCAYEIFECYGHQCTYKQKKGEIYCGVHLKKVKKLEE